MVIVQERLTASTRPVRGTNYILAYDTENTYIGTIYFNAAGMRLQKHQKIADAPTWKELYEKLDETTVPERPRH